jgi:tetratricopeptide (TPR) repeat protein
MGLLASALILVSLSFGQDGPLPPEWFYYQQCLESFRKGDFGGSMKHLKDLTDAYGESAESQHLLGRIYEQEGELDLAEKYYLRALERSGSLKVPDEKYEIRYRLANMYYQRKNYKKFEDTLEQILSDQSLYTEARYERIRTSYVSTLMSRGLDSLALMYRIPFDFAQEAHRELGIFYCRTGRERGALLHLAFANLALISTLSDELKRHDPDYNYISLEDALDKCSSRSYLTDFLRRGEIFRSLYFLASALYGAGVPGEARRVWTLVSEYGSGEWKTQSRNQLLAPKAEPLITY